MRLLRVTKDATKQRVQTGLARPRDAKTKTPNAAAFAQGTLANSRDALDL